MNPTVAVIAVAVLTATVVAFDSPCSPGEIFKLGSLATNPKLLACTTSCGWSPVMGDPTKDQQAKMCSSPDCHVLVEDISKLKPMDCLLKVGPRPLNVYKLTQGFEATCSTPQ